MTQKELAIHFGKAIVLRGVWKWKQYHTFDTDFGWCIYAADDEAKESMANLFETMTEYDCIHCYVRVQKSSGKEEIVRLPQQCFDDNRCLRWFEYGKSLLKEQKSEYTKRAKAEGIKTKFEVIEL